MTRLYFNIGGKLPWSTDNGTGTPERQWSKVLISAPGTCVFQPEAGDDQNAPTAWIAFERVEEWLVAPGIVDIRRLGSWI